MPSMVFKPGDIDSNSSEIVVNDGDIDSRSSEIVVVDGIADAASDDATGASIAASDASVAASGAAVAGSSNSSDVAAIEGDNRYAKSIYSDPSSGSYAITKIDVPSGSDAIFIDYSSSAAE